VLRYNSQDRIQISLKGQTTQKFLRTICFTCKNVDGRGIIEFLLFLIEFDDGFVGREQLIDIFIPDEQYFDIIVEIGTDL